MSGNGQLEQTQRQVQEVVGVMRNNIDEVKMFSLFPSCLKFTLLKVLKRDSKLNDLDHRANNLQATSAVFQQSSRKLRKKYWWQ